MQGKTVFIIELVDSISRDSVCIILALHEHALWEQLCLNICSRAVCIVYSCTFLAQCLLPSVPNKKP